MEACITSCNRFELLRKEFQIFERILITLRNEPSFWERWTSASVDRWSFVFMKSLDLIEFNRLKFADHYSRDHVKLSLISRIWIFIMIDKNCHFAREKWKFISSGKIDIIILLFHSRRKYPSFQLVLLFLLKVWNHFTNLKKNFKKNFFFYLTKYIYSIL